MPSPLSCFQPSLFPKGVNGSPQGCESEKAGRAGGLGP